MARALSTESSARDLRRLRRYLDEATTGRIWLAGYGGYAQWMAGEVRAAVERNRRGRVTTALSLPDFSALLPWPAAADATLELLYVDRRLGKLVADGHADYIPMHFSTIPRVLQRRKLPIELAAIQVTPPDSEGRCHLGLSVDVIPEAVTAAEVVVAQVNANLPRCRGSAWIHRDAIDVVVRQDEPLQELPVGTPSDVQSAIATYVVDLVEDGATVQLGLGSTMRAIAERLTQRRGLHIHTGIVTNEIMELYQASSALTADRHPAIVATMAMGDATLHRFVNDNPAVELYPISFTHAVTTLAALRKLVAINSAFEVDLTGAINAEKISGEYAGGVGGQTDFARGAVNSGGRFVVALPSTTASGKSRIVPFFPQCTPVTTARVDAEWVVTEYGAVNVSAMSVERRAAALISITHPSHRTSLASQWKSA